MPEFEFNSPEAERVYNIVHAALSFDGDFILRRPRETMNGEYHDLCTNLYKDSGIQMWFISPYNPKTVARFGDFEAFVAIENDHYYFYYDRHVYVDFQEARVFQEDEHPLLDYMDNMDVNTEVGENTKLYIAEVKRIFEANKDR